MKFGLPCSLDTAPLRRLMEEVFHGSVWSAICPMLGTNDVVRLRLPSAGKKVIVIGKWVEYSFQLLHSDTFAKHGYYDDMGY